MQLVVGRITRPHGVRGEVSVEVRTDEPDRRFAVGCVLATDPVAAGPLTVESVRWHSGRLLIRFAGVADRNQAEDLRGIWLTLDSAEAGPTGDPDEFHDHELIGLAVVTTSGEPVGRVTDVRHFGQDLLVIEPRARHVISASPGWGSPGRPRPGRPRPGARRRGPGRAGQRAAGPVRGRDRARSRCGRGRLVIDPPPGLLELAAGEPGQAHAADARPAGARAPGTVRQTSAHRPAGTVRRHVRQAPSAPGGGRAPADTVRQQPVQREPVQREAEVSRVRIDIITIFPDYFAPLSVSLLGKAASRGDIQLQVHDLRTWAHGVHRAVDDAPFGGGPGMVMSPEPWGEALDAVTGSGPAPARLVVPTPSGVPFTQAMAAGVGSLRIIDFCLWPVRGDRRAGCGRGAGPDAGR